MTTTGQQGGICIFESPKWDATQMHAKRFTWYKIFQLKSSGALQNGSELLWRNPYMK